MAQIAIGRAGTYRVALGDFVWVDLVREGTPAETVNFGHGPRCTPIRKIVDFELEPGTHVLEISGALTPAVRVMVLPRPE